MKLLRKSSQIVKVIIQVGQVGIVRRKALRDRRNNTTSLHMNFYFRLL